MCAAEPKNIGCRTASFVKYYSRSENIVLSPTEDSEMGLPR